ncbi:CPBP family intramembrane glutamic endopeptidase [Chitinophaga sp. GCM10012297]|uniref:CPBP family intramembrane metalloprotease n=1 Tax=Chitinophaga chungangae TaxID=2821488 RepID=A0ABS3YDE1_9BACT|nr:type II CAAX endopeptidase family protein [Chitinophaga chungangae]MBO9152700.1 CPBP family intramembrane metalloprotease [Chitinophaga chungangae]
MYVKTLNGLSLNGAWKMQISLYAGWIGGAGLLYCFTGSDLLLYAPLLVTIYLLSGVSVILCTLINKKDNFRLIPKINISVETFLLAFSMALALVMVKDALGYLLPIPPWPELSFTSIHTGSGYMIVVSVMLAAFMEELVFRGIMMEALMKRYSGGVALLQSSLLFMLAHPDPAQMPGAFLLGLLTGLFYLRLRDLCACFLIHLTHNVATALLVSAGTFQFMTASPVMYSMIIAGCVTVLFAGYFMIRKLVPVTPALQQAKKAAHGKPVLLPK